MQIAFRTHCRIPKIDDGSPVTPQMENSNSSNVILDDVVNNVRRENSRGSAHLEQDDEGINDTDQMEDYGDDADEEILDEPQLDDDDENGSFGRVPAAVETFPTQHAPPLVCKSLHPSSHSHACYAQETPFDFHPLLLDDITDVFTHVPTTFLAGALHQ